ncbi:glycoside hydrolase family 76 protein [Sulfurimonas sp. ST-25]|uniref:glycoside hydrolase family 76 protein n=1 Tax=Sulfurimonas sp. ST-25 TaxID=3400151 RepID=UPI003A8C6D1A
MKNLFRHLILVLWFVTTGFASTIGFGNAESIADHNTRNEVLTYARAVAQSHFSAAPVPDHKVLAVYGDWTVSVTPYLHGEIVGEGTGQAHTLRQAIEHAVQDLLAGPSHTHPSAKDFAASRLMISFARPDAPAHALIEYKSEAKELIGDVVVIRHLDSDLIYTKIMEAKAYLLRAMDKETHGFHKLYTADDAAYDRRVITTYSSSSLYSLLKLNDLEKDERIAALTPLIAEFILSMQIQKGSNKGAFHYSLSLDTGKKDDRFVVGTASKTIFTLLDLYKRTKEKRYLDAAVSAADWLLTMRNPDGTVINQVKIESGLPVFDKRYSNLYTGEVLSALSRMYAVTSDQRYYDAAAILADNFRERAAKDSYFLTDDYRTPTDAVPTSWAVMSLLDFYKISKNDLYKKTLLKCLDTIFTRQKNDPNDMQNYGRIGTGQNTSGNGWINEVTSEVYLSCRRENWGGCERYKAHMLGMMRWLIQNTYSEENTYFLKAPEKAIGGLIRNYTKEEVRTDAVCHGVNGYINLFKSSGR